MAYPYLPLTDYDRREMLSALGVRDFEALVANIPKSLRHVTLHLPEPKGELELLRELADRLQSRDSKKYLSFLGGGSYEHFIPAVVPFLAGRSEFYTPYTPYQAEASQGTLQVIYEYQSLICALTAMDVANASHYDGATATAEAALLAASHTQRTKILVARTLHPDYRSVVQTYLKGTTRTAEEVRLSKDGTLDVADLKKKLDETMAALIVQTPNFLGLLEDLTEVEKLVHQNGSLLIVVANPLSLGVCRAPGEWRADVACGEGQVLGLPRYFGGPYLGYFTVKQELMRKIPGRLCGVTQDLDQNRSFVLTLQAREQHIRREKASSNICTNEALCALTACLYLVTLGKEGIRRIGTLNLERANVLRSKLASFSSIKIPFVGTIFNEFVVQTAKPVEVVLKALQNDGIWGGISLKSSYPELGEAMLVCATEMRTEADLERLVGEIRKMG